MKFWKKAFTLVIVLGVLAAVAVPKFSRVLETRRTTEAENMLSAVRMEQEKRCTLGKKYTGDFADISTVAYAKTGVAEAKSSNYTYKLTTVGVEANRADSNYTLKIPSYKSGELCCSGEGCEALNKSYPDCATIAAVSDECAADACDVAPNTCDCATYANNNKCECSPSVGNCCAAGSGAVSYTNGQCVCPSGQTYSGSKCVDICGEGEYWDAGTSSCKDICSEDQVWNSSTKQCDERCTEAQVWNSDTKQCDERCTGGATWNGTECACAEGQIWNEESQRCEAACTPSCGDPSKVANQDNPPADTCNGDQQNKYTCDGSYEGTCTDVYYSSGLASFNYTLTPAPGSGSSGCPNGHYIAKGGSCGTGRCTSDAGCCESSTGVCSSLGSNTSGNFCRDGEKYVNGRCVPDIGGGIGGNGGFNPVDLSGYYSREVTCCKGNKGCTVDPCVATPNSCACSTYASAHSCECSPSTNTCCTNEERFAGKEYINGSCVCRSGKEENGKCVSVPTEEKKTYTCFTSLVRTNAEPSKETHPTEASGIKRNWRTISWNGDMKCYGETVSQGTYTPGQEDSCTPGTWYRHYLTYGYCDQQGNNCTQYKYVCMLCSEVQSLSSCSTTTVNEGFVL